MLVGLLAALAGCAAVPAAATPPRPATAAPPTQAASPTRPAPTLQPTPEPTREPTPEPTREPTPEPTPELLAYEQRAQIFEEVWRTVKEHYLYPDFHQVDWDALHDEYAQRLEAEQTRDEFYTMMVELVAQLDDQHSRFLPPAAAQTENATISNSEVTVGIGVLTRPRPDGGFIQIVFPDSPAARADLAPRDRIIAVDGRAYRADDGNLLGEAGSAVRLTVVRPGAKLRDVVLTRQEVQNHIVPSYRRFPSDIGYVAIPTLWVNDMDEQVNGALTDLVAEGPLNGLILDMRSNGGGWLYVLSGLLSHFVRGQVGMFFNRQAVRPLEISAPAGPDLRSVRLVVLVDNDTASYAEVLAAVLQHEKQAIVVGTRTAGNTETTYAYTLTDGSRLWLAQEGFRLQNGTNLEGLGVEPDTTVDVDWTHYSEDDDPQLLEALRLLGAGPK
ncbi:MAG: PDZ domain-containing protein [Kouleothrix sp.]|jgi:C-terminal peptidase prc|nr:PDZ domain-containing protein [Kouleothrix sp.]